MEHSIQNQLIVECNNLNASVGLFYSQHQIVYIGRDTKFIFRFTTPSQENDQH